MTQSGKGGKNPISGVQFLKGLALFRFRFRDQSPELGAQIGRITGQVIRDLGRVDAGFDKFDDVRRILTEFAPRRLWSFFQFGGFGASCSFRVSAHDAGRGFPDLR